MLTMKWWFPTFFLVISVISWWFRWFLVISVNRHTAFWDPWRLKFDARETLLVVVLRRKQHTWEILWPKDQWQQQHNHSLHPHEQRILDFSSIAHCYDPSLPHPFPTPMTPTLWLQQAGQIVAVFPADCLSRSTSNFPSTVATISK